VPFSFLPLDGLSDTQLDLFLSARARDAAGQDNEQLPGRRVMAACSIVREGSSTRFMPRLPRRE
jgi:hypothetical protein